MPVIYREKKIIPAPLLTWSFAPEKAGNGATIGQTFDFTVRGTLVAWKGSPNSSGNFWNLSDYPPDEVIDQDSRLEAIQRKQEALVNLFSVEGALFEWQPWNGNAPVKCNATNIQVSFDEGIWTERCDYTVTFQSDNFYGPLNPEGIGAFPEYVSSVDESWTLENAERAENQDQQNTFRLTHNISAVGKRHYLPNGTLEKEAWVQARDWVLPRLGLDTDMLIGSGVLNVPSYFTGFNHVRTEAPDILAGSYAVTETWVVSSGNVLEDFSVSVNSGIDDSLVRVSVQGTLNGMDTRDSSYNIVETKYEAALGKFQQIQSSIFSRAQTFGNVTLNLEPVSLVVGHNPIEGIITYSLDYDTRPQKIISGAKSEVISIEDDYGSDIIPRIFILGRQGPILQNLNTIGATTRHLSIEAQMNPVAAPNFAAWQAAKPNVEAIIDMVRPDPTQTYKEKNTENWTPTNGRYTRNVSWVYEPD